MIKKSKKSLTKQLFKIFYKNENFTFFKFFTENIFITILRGRKTPRKDY